MNPKSKHLLSFFPKFALFFGLPAHPNSLLEMQFLYTINPLQNTSNSIPIALSSDTYALNKKLKPKNRKRVICKCNFVGTCIKFFFLMLSIVKYYNLTKLIIKRAIYTNSKLVLNKLMASIHHKDIKIDASSGYC